MLVLPDRRRFVGILLVITGIFLVVQVQTGSPGTKFHGLGSLLHSQSRIFPTFKPHTLHDVKANIPTVTLYLDAVQSHDIKLLHDLNIDLPTLFSRAETSSSGNAINEHAPIQVPVPSIPGPTDASHIIFGIATTYDRLCESLESFAHWAAGTGATIVVLIPRPTPRELLMSPEDEKDQWAAKALERVTDQALRLHVNLMIQVSEEDYIPRYVELVRVLEQEAKPTTKWISILDDDTYFLSTHRLVRMLEKYNSEEPHYVGGLTEDLKAFEKWGYLAFGGAGIFLSVPLVQRIVPHLETCKGFGITSGDGKIAECVYQFSNTKLEVEPGLNQLDLWGDHAGFYEAVRPLPTSVHHWKSWGHYNMLAVGAIGQITGQDSILQKYRLTDNWWMTHGFSIVHYSDESLIDSDSSPHYESREQLAHKDGAMERTFDPLPDENEKTFLHSLAPLRAKDPYKIQFLMEQAVQEDEHTMSLYYVRRINDVAESMIRVVWTGPS